MGIKQGNLQFFSNNKVTDKTILAAHKQTTLERCRTHQRVLALPDTTEVDFTTHPKVKDAGYLHTQKSRGFLMHSVLTASTDGVPLGLLSAEMWTRPHEDFGKASERKKKPFAEKESARWLRAVEAASGIVSDGSTTEVISIGDRENDIYEVFSAERLANVHLLIRLGQNRRILAPSLSAGSLSVSGVSACDDSSEVDSLTKTRIKEYAATLPLESIDDAITMVRYYALRWLIERLHYTLKSGCGIEKLQLETMQRLQNAVATHMLVAWRLLWLTYAARVTPEASCEIMLEPHEWQALHAVVCTGEAMPTQAPTLQQAVLWIARLGGFLARNRDGAPGVKVLWLGWSRLTDIVRTWVIAKEHFSTP